MARQALRPHAVLLPDEMSEGNRRDSRKLKKLGAKTFRECAHYDYSTASGNLAVSSGNFSMTVEPKGGGAAQTMEGRFTSVAARKGGKWMYVSDHASVPMPPPEAMAK